MKKIEIIERITDANGSISENILTSWEHKNQFIPEIIRFGELKIYLQERIVKKNDSDVHLSKYEYDILLFLAKSPVCDPSRSQDPLCSFRTGDT